MTEVKKFKMAAEKAAFKVQIYFPTLFNMATVQTHLRSLTLKFDIIILY